MSSTNRKHVYLAEIEDGQLVYIDDIIREASKMHGRPTSRLFIGHLNLPFQYSCVLVHRESVESGLIFVTATLGELSWYPGQEDERPQWNGTHATKLAFEDYEYVFSNRRLVIRQKTTP